MKGLLADSKHAFRLYRRTPLASLIAVGVLAIGMAFVGSFLSLYVDLVLRPHPGIENSSRIVSISIRPGAIRLGLLELMAEEASSLEAVAGVNSTALATGPEREARFVELVTREFFPGFRPRLAIGRGFEDVDHAIDAAPVAVISDDYWRERFDRNPDVIGRVVEIHRRSENDVIRTVDGRPEISRQEQDGEESTGFRIVGVMAPAMKGLWESNAELWLPLERAVSLIYSPERIEESRPYMTVEIVGRYIRGASAAAVANELESRYSDINDFMVRPGVRLDAIEGIVRDFGSQRDARRQLQLFLAGSVLLALVAAANVSLFLLARAPGRRRELGIRMAVGAPERRLAQQLASESGLLVLVSAALGLMASVWLSNFLRGLSFLQRAEWGDVTLLDWRVLGLVGGFLLFVTLAVSLAPILGLKRLGIAASSRQVAASASLAQRIAGTAQIAIAGTFAGAGIAFAWYLGSMIFGDPGYEPDDLYFAEFRSTFAGLGGITVVLSIGTQEREREAIESLPGVEGVAFGGPVPGHGGGGQGSRILSHPEDPTREIEFATGTIDSRFIDVVGLRLLYGRAPADGESGVAVVNLTAAREYFGRDNVVRESLPITASPRETGSSEIVGVIEDLPIYHPAAAVQPLVLLVPRPDASGGRGTVIRSSRPVADLQRDFQALVDSGALEVESVSLGSVALQRSFRLAPDRARGFLTMTTAGLVVLLAAMGFYGTQRYLLAAGRREYAIRASLGAGPGALGRLVLWRGLTLSMPGLVAGGLLAFIAVAWMRDDFLSREVSAGAVTAAVVVGLAAVLFAASLGPAREAKRTQPAPLLRED